ncbi:hypothetical protein ABZ208_35285 [Streptomyces sp. NPDC006208]|uniref:hypothetical protein n=1 Tax=Streptomyces sp. NPDC006208 TaxID=3156734 RepID=UPI0033A3E622
MAAALKQWDYVVTVADGRPGLITLDLGGMYRVRHHHGPARRDEVREATYWANKVRRATEQEAAAAIAEGVTREAERSGLGGRR